MIAVVTFKWSTPGYDATFTAEHVNTLRRMVARHYPDNHRFICVTDDAYGIDQRVEIVPLWHDHASVPNPTGSGRPTCYRRLKLWSRDAAEMLSLYEGDRIVWLDLDTVIVGDLRPLWNRDEDVVLWRNPENLWPYNGATGIMTIGARPQVWEDFDPIESPARTHAAGYRGSDQAWLSLTIPGEATWSQADGVHYVHDTAWTNKRVLPDGARLVFFTGRRPPWASTLPWVREHYR